MQNASPFKVGAESYNFQWRVKMQSKVKMSWNKNFFMLDQQSDSPCML